MAVYILLSLDCYLRPSEALGLTKGDLIRPTSSVRHWSLLLHPSEGLLSSKTGMTDESLVLDSEEYHWMGPIWEQISAGNSNEALFPFDYLDVYKEVQMAGKAFGLKKFTPYLLRHSGASIDQACQKRTLTETQKRGRWASMKSVTRYEQHAQLARVEVGYNAEFRRLALTCQDELQSVMLRLKPPIQSNLLLG